MVNYLILALLILNLIPMSLESHGVKERPEMVSSSIFGSGTTTDPFTITNMSELQAIDLNLSAHYLLANDINASGTRDWNDGKGFKPIGSKNAPFLGSLDGGGFTISSLFINRTDEDLVALFARIQPSSTISNLTIDNSTVKGRDFTGTLVGQNYGTVRNVTILYGYVEGRNDTGGQTGYSKGLINKNSYNGMVKGYMNIGGIVGRNEFNVSSCRTKIMIDGIINTGGLIGRNSNDIIDCFASGYVEGDDQVGGALGENYRDIFVRNSGFIGSVHGKTSVGGFMGLNYGWIIDCWTKGNVSCPESIGPRLPYYWMGGFVGVNGGKINSSYSEVNISGSADCMGGFVGRNWYGTINECFSNVNITSSLTYSLGGFVGFNDGNPSSIYSCYSLGYISGTNNIGGFVGYNFARITNCYSMTTTNVTNNTGGGFCGTNGGGWNIQARIMDSYSMGNVHGKNITGGFVGFNDYEIIHCFFNKDTTGLDHSDGDGSTSIAPLSIIEALFVVSSSKFDWDFSTIWGQAPGQTYPYLRWENNNPPIMEDFELPELIEDHPFSIDLKATDIDFKDIIPFWNLTSDRKWLKIEKENGRLYGTPLGEDCSTSWVTISVTDGRGGWDHINKTLSVTPINDAPIISGEPATTILEDSKYGFTFKGVDEDDDELSWGFSTDADWLILRSNKNYQFIPQNEAWLSASPENGDVGEWSFKISLSDNNGSTVHKQFEIEVIQVNERPRIKNECPYKIEEGDFSFQYIASDEENDPLVWYLRTDASWLSIDNIAGRLYGTTTDSDLGNYMVNISVSDGNGGRDYNEFIITVENVNDDPHLYSIPDEIAYEDQPYEFHFQALDTDPTMDTLEWEIEPIGSWFTIDASTGWMRGTPENDDVGPNPVRVTVHDGNGGTDQLSFTINVKNINDPPYWIETPKMVKVMEGEKVVLQASAGDIDVGDRIRYGIATTPSTEINIDELTGGITWESAITGSYNVRITATDGTEMIASSFWLDVEKEVMVKNTKPYIQSIPDQKAWVGELFIVVIMGHDPDTTDAIVLNYSLINGPNGSAFSKDGVFSWTPKEEDIGTHIVTVALNDTMDQATMSYFIEVKKRPKDTDIPWALLSLIALITVVLPLTIIMFIIIKNKRDQRQKREDLSFYTPFYIKKYEGMAAAKPPLPPRMDQMTNKQGTKGKGP